MAGIGQLRGLQVLRYQNPLFGNQLYDDLTENVTGLSIQTQAVGGFGTCDFTVNGAYLDLLAWVNPYNPFIGDRILVLDPAMVTIYEGYIYQTDLSINDTVWSVSLNNMYNKVTLQYQNTSDKTIRVSDSASQSQYGIKEYHVQIGRANSVEATAMANRILNEYKAVQHGKDTVVGGGAWARTLKVKCFGYYSTLGWQLWNRAIKKLADTSVVVKDVLGLRGQYISTDYSNIQTTGTMVERDHPSWTPAIDYIREKVDYGDVNNRRVTAGVWANRVFYMQSRPTTAKYFTDVGMAAVYDAYRNEVPLYKVQAGQYIHFGSLSPDILTYADAAQDPQASFIETTEYNVDTDTVAITPPGSVSASLWVGRLVHGVPPNRV